MRAAPPRTTKGHPDRYDAEADRDVSARISVAGRSVSWAAVPAIPICSPGARCSDSAEADVVFYDALVDREALALAPTARRVFVGKRAGRAAVSQEAIQRLMVRAAQRGLRVVRLKGGDPFVFGRGGEEALALSAAGIPFEVVPA